MKKEEGRRKKGRIDGKKRIYKGENTFAWKVMVTKLRRCICEGTRKEEEEEQVYACIQQEGGNISSATVLQSHRASSKNDNHVATRLIACFCIPIHRCMQLSNQHRIFVDDVCMMGAHE